MAPSEPAELLLSLRLKYGKHTILLFADPLSPFSVITTDLLSILRERYPSGLYASRRSTTPSVPIPASDEAVHVSYAVLKVASDPNQGWRNLKISGDEKVVDKGIKNNACLAFRIGKEGEDGGGEFEVEWPRDEDEMEE